jgi:signal transduction histidine kinase/ligand-binding sensor domain-containing protein/CheY-like chemotaxis protein
MKLLSITVLVSLILSMDPFDANSQQNLSSNIDNNLIFNKVFYNDQNSFGIVEVIFQDRSGFIWFGSKDGLFRYDGIEYRSYYFDRKNNTSISNNILCDIFGDSEGIMWIATENGLNRYNKEKDNFIRYFGNINDSSSLSTSLIRKIAEDKNGNLLLATQNGGLCMLNKKTNRFTRYLENSVAKRRILSNNLRTVYVDNEGIIWIGTVDKGVNYILPDGKINSFLPGKNDGKHLYGEDIRCITEGPDGKMWFGTQGKGISCYDKKSHSFTYYAHDATNSNSLASNVIYVLFVDSRHNLWACTEDGGLNLFLPDMNGFRQFRNSVNDPTSISSDIVRTIIEDNAGNYWIGNFNAPVNYVDMHRKKFTTLHSELNCNKCFNYKQIVSFLVDSYKKIWIGADGGGLNCVDLATGKNETFSHNPADKNSIGSNKPLSLAEDGEGNIWIGFFDRGLGCYVRKTKSFINFFPDGTNKTPRGKRIWHLMIDNNKLWVATEKGIDILDLQTKTFTYLPIGKEDQKGTNVGDCWYLYKDSKGRILIGTIYGLNVYYPGSKRFEYFEPDLKNPNSISDKWILNIFEDSKHRIWIGTNGGGLNLWKEPENIFHCFTSNDGLAGNVINGILEDDLGYLWISTNHGLTKFNYDSLSFVTYDIKDGLQDNRFSIGVASKDKNGKMYFGGINGLTSFYPGEIKENSFVPPVILTSFQLFNKDVDINNPKSPVHESMQTQKEINLSASQSVFTIKFAALNYTQSEENKYKYKLDNLEDQWNSVGHQHSATYTYLAPGKYKFRVIASNNDNVWNSKGASIDIIVHPPFYKTWWFFSSEIILFLLIIYSIYILRINEIRKRNKNLAELVADRTHQLEDRNEEISLQRDIATTQRDKIITQNEELEMHRNKLSELVEVRTKELLEAKQKAEESDKLKTAFLENISHEIRTPLNAILGFINLLDDDNENRENDKYYYRIINESGRSLLRLIEDIIDFSRLQTGELKASYTTCNINELIKQLIASYRDKTSREKPDINIITELPPEKLMAHTDQKKLTQVFAKLIENAIKFTERGYIKIGVSEIKNNYITFFVEDSGIGIHPEYIDKIFERFFKIEEKNSSKLYRGAGLGLALARQLTAVLGGKIWVQSEYGKGSIFYFTIAFLKPHEELNGFTNLKSNMSYFWPGKMVLVAEDEDSNYLLLEAFFKDTGVQLLHAKDGVEFLEIIDSEQHIDLVLLDINMPRMNGLNAIKIIRNSKKQVPVIAQTAYDITYHREKCLEYGCNEFLIKPIKKDNLLEVAKKYLG